MRQISDLIRPVCTAALLAVTAGIFAIPVLAQDPAPAPAKEAGGDARLDEAIRFHQIREQEKQAQAQVLYEQALKYFQQSQFATAEDIVQESLVIYPDHEEALRLLDRIRNVTGHSGSHEFVRDDIEQHWVTRTQQIHQEVKNHIAKGERLLAEKDFENALREFVDGRRKLKAMPWDLDMKTELLPRVEALIRKSKDDQNVFQRQLENQRIAAARNVAVLEEQQRQREVRETVRDLLNEAIKLYEHQKYDRSIRVCRDILRIDPHYRAALELISFAQHVRHSKQEGVWLDKRVKEWKKLGAQDHEELIPYAATLTYPNPEEWAEISQRIGVFIVNDNTQEDPDILAIQNKLDTVEIDLEFKDAALVDIIDFIREYADINIVVDEEVRDDGVLEEVTSFRVKKLPLKSALTLLLGNFDLNYTFQDKVLLITSAAKSYGTPTLEIHDVRDLLIKISDFPGPQVELKPPGDAGGGGGVGGATFSLEEEREGAITEDQIEDLVRENVSPASWDEGDFSITLTPNQQLLVNHVPAVQRQVREFLSKLRQYSGAMVKIDAKFVAAHDNFLEDVSVNLMEAAGGPQVGQNDPAGAGGAGWFTSGTTEDGTWDFRSRLFHTFNNAGAQIFPFGQQLSNQGGIGIEYNFIGDDPLNMIFRAVKKSELATILDAPQITVFNTQRANITVVTQRAYIGDYEAQLATFALIYDPVVMYIQDGLVLDVRPVISHDRKYVTLELRPAFAAFQQFRTLVPFTGLGASLTYQLPFIIFQKGEMTVRVPDQGTILASGFKDILSRDLYSEMPLFGKIPILNFFLSRKAKSVEKRRLLLLVTPEIIDLGEYESDIQNTTVDQYPYK